MKRYQPSRRDFLKTSTAVAGAAATLTVARGAHAAGSDAIKFALIGCGGRGTGAAANCMNVQQTIGQKIKLVAVADAFEDRANGALNQLKKGYAGQIDVPKDRVFVGLDAYKKAIDSDVDMVVMGTPPGFRPIHYAYAVEKGKHVFMEKPCCTDAPGFRSLLESNKLADQKKLKVVVGLQRHHQAGYIQGVNEIHDGKLGDLLFLRVYWNGLGGGARDIGPRKPGQKDEMQFQIRNWGCFLWLYGDNIVEQHVHNLDIANWALSKQGLGPDMAHPLEANGMGGRVHKGNYGDILDHHAVEYTYKDGVKVFSQSRHIEGTWDQVNEHAHGTKSNRGVATGGGPKLENGNPYDQEHVDLVKAILKDQPLNEGWFGAYSSMTAVLGRMATYSGQIVKWDDAVAKGPQESPEQIAWDALPRHLPNEDGFYPFPVPGVYKPY